MKIECDVIDYAAAAWLRSLFCTVGECLSERTRPAVAEVKFTSLQKKIRDDWAVQFPRFSNFLIKCNFVKLAVDAMDCENAVTRGRCLMSQVCDEVHKDPDSVACILVNGRRTPYNQHLIFAVFIIIF